MKKLFTICLIIATLISIEVQSQFTGNLNYRNNIIDADFEVGISDYKSQGGIFYQFVVYNITINSIQVGNRELAESEIPFAVLSKLKKEMRIGSINLDLYVNNSFLKKIDTNSTVYWAELQGLDKAEGYKPAVKDKGHKLFDDGLVSIKNPVINTLTYMLDSDYRKSIEQPKVDNKSNANASNNNGEVTELGLKMPGLVVSGSESSSNKSSSNSKSSSDVESPSSNVSSYTPTYTKQEITNQVVAGVAGLAGEMINEWNTNYDKKVARWEAESKANVEFIRKQNEKEGEIKFLDEYSHLMESAKNGDENARMTLYLASDRFHFTKKVPERDQWLDKAVTNRNCDALMTYIRHRYKYTAVDEKALESIANVGCIDAMVGLVDYYNRIPSKLNAFNAGQNESKALEWLNKASDMGSPNAMYMLGMIYKYGMTQSKPGNSIYKRNFIKYAIEKNEKLALEYFLKSYEAKDKYQKSIYAELAYTHYEVSEFDYHLYQELYKIYNEGKIVPKDKIKAQQFKSHK